jgi:hypothetical protein
VFAWFKEFAATHESLLWGVSVGSVLVFVGSLALLPWLVKRAPEDFFVRPPRPHHKTFWLLVIGRNVLGLALVIAGVMMLVLPGQGALALLAGLSLLDFPGKRRALHWLVTRASVTRSLQWLRKRVHRPPFKLPDGA